MSRLLKDKGLYKTIIAYDLLRKKYNNIRLYICGDGEEKNNLLTDKIARLNPNTLDLDYLEEEDLFEFEG